MMASDIHDRPDKCPDLSKHVINCIFKVANHEQKGSPGPLSVFRVMQRTAACECVVRSFEMSN